MAIDEPPQPERGRTADEREPDVSAAEQQLADARSWPQQLVAAANPKLVLSQADGYPPGIKQFLQFCLILVYPAWLFCVLIAWPVWLVFKVLEWILWVLFTPLRLWMKKHHPEDYAASQEK
jgi:hypothetical protein